VTHFRHPAQAASATVAFVAGAVVAVQSRINGALGRLLNDGVEAALISFAVGLVILIVVVMVRAAGRTGLTSLRTHLRDRSLPWWCLLGGFAGAFYVSTQSITVATLGVALFTVSTVAGQTGMSLVVDRAGLGPGGVVHVTGLRVVAAVLATIAVAVAAGSRGWSGDVSWLYVGLALGAGAAVAFQAAVNGRVSVASRQPTVAALVNFTVGSVALLVVMAIMLTIGGRAWAVPPSLVHHGWLYLGGPLGVIFVVSAAWSVRALGVLLFSLVVIAGQLLGAVALDLVAPTAGSQVTSGVLLGVALTAGAVALAALPGRRRSTVRL
jgi:bacterial/archaeal transporter family-2 protein